MITLTQERVQLILKEAKESEGFGPWVDRIKLTEIEKDELNRAWNLLPGDTNQIDVLNRIANGTLKVPE